MANTAIISTMISSLVFGAELAFVAKFFGNAENLAARANEDELPQPLTTLDFC
jgi:hypothetical protein